MLVAECVVSEKEHEDSLLKSLFKVIRRTVLSPKSQRVRLGGQVWQKYQKVKFKLSI